jgi:2-dehydropantoate 2-reductase
MGAGSIGCYLGGRLARTCDVTLVGRPAAMAAIAERGLVLGAPGQPPETIPPDQVRLATTTDGVHGADVVLVTVKSAGTSSAGRQLAPALAPRAVVVSLQNGLHNAERLRAALDSRMLANPVLAGMVAFNVVQPAPATYYRATSGEIMVQRDDAVAALLEAADRAALPIRAREDMREVLHAKLLMNLNNAVNALSGLTLREQLGQRDYRRVLALCQEEALAVFAREGVAPARLGPIPPAATIRLLRCPDPIFKALAASSLRVDPQARSSMADDLALGRRTEVDELQGEVARLGEQHGIPTPACDRILDLVRKAEADGPGRLPAWSGPALLREVTDSRG